jgi:hypothetical protein
MTTREERVAARRGSVAVGAFLASKKEERVRAKATKKITTHRFYKSGEKTRCGYFDVIQDRECGEPLSRHLGRTRK